VIAGIIVGAEWYADNDLYVAGLLGVLGFVVGILSFFAIGTITKERVPTFLLGALILLSIGISAQPGNLEIIQQCTFLHKLN